jgi:hypothetical protein
MEPLPEAVLFISIYTYCSVMINVLYFTFLLKGQMCRETLGDLHRCLPASWLEIRVSQQSFCYRLLRYTFSRFSSDFKQMLRCFPSAKLQPHVSRFQSIKIKLHSCAGYHNIFPNLVYMVPLHHKIKILCLLSEASTSRHNKIKLSLSKPRRRTGGQEVQLHSFLNSALGEGAEL